MSAHAVAACAELGIPLLRLQRPGWVPVTGDRWIRVPAMRAAAEALPLWGSRVLLTTGRQDLAAFADLDLHFVARSVEAPTGRLPAQLVTILGRPPWSLDVERLLFREHAIDVLVTKDSGGPTAPKLTAARELGIPVVMVDRRIASDNFVTFFNSKFRPRFLINCSYNSPFFIGKNGQIQSA